jgi:hypothetical protein
MHQFSGYTVSLSLALTVTMAKKNWNPTEDIILLQNITRSTKTKINRENCGKNKKLTE